MNRFWGVVFVLLFILSMGYFASAETPVLGGSGEKIIDTAQKTQDAIDQGKTQFLGEQWKDFLLRSKVIKAFDTFFTKINILFVILFARSYSFSIELFFALLLWVFVVLSLPGYLFVIENGNYRNVAAFVLTILLAHLQVFNALSRVIVKLYFYRVSALWSLMIFVLTIVILIVFYRINMTVCRAMRIERERNKRKGVEKRVMVLEAYKQGLDRADRL